MTQVKCLDCDKIMDNYDGFCFMCPECESKVELNTD